MLIITTISILKNKYYHLVQGSGNTPSEYGSVRRVLFQKYTCLLGTCSCDNVAVSDFLFYFILIFLGDGYDSILGFLQWRKSGSDSLPMCLGHFTTSHIKLPI